MSITGKIKQGLQHQIIGNLILIYLGLISDRGVLVKNAGFILQILQKVCNIKEIDTIFFLLFFRNV